MANYKSNIKDSHGITSFTHTQNDDQKLNWLLDLAQAEIHPDAERVLGLSKSFDPTLIIEESAQNFIATLREKMTEYSKFFNHYSNSGTQFQEIKIYSLAQTTTDFMLFRNQMKLTVALAAPGTVQISFSQHLKSTPVLQQQGETTTIELQAQMNPFREVFWTYQGEVITAEQVAKYYFSEFIRVSRAQSIAKDSNQKLYDQLRELLSR
jgi:hypothetical protein